MKKAFFIFFCFFSLKQFSQNNALAKNAFLQQDIQTAFEYLNISQPSTSFHSSFRPYLSSTFSEAKDSLVPFKIYSFNNTYRQKIIHESLLSHNKVTMQFQPILDVEAGYDFLLKALYVHPPLVCM